jgi:hypothetical protein
MTIGDFMKKLYVMFSLLAVSLLLYSNAYSQSYTTYHTKGQKNSKGVSISVDIPPGYLSSAYPFFRPDLVSSYEDINFKTGLTKTLQIVVQGDNPSIVRKFFGTQENYDYCSMSDSELQSFLQSPQPVQDFPGTTLTFDSYNKKLFGGMCGLLFTSTLTSQNGDDSIFVSQTVFTFGYFSKNAHYPRYVTLNCNTAGRSGITNKVKKAHLSDVEELCIPYFKSLKVYDR